MKDKEIVEYWNDVSGEGWKDPLHFERKPGDTKVHMVLHRDRAGQAIVLCDSFDRRVNLKMLLGDQRRTDKVEVLDSAGDVRIYFGRFAVDFEVALKAVRYFLDYASLDPSLEWGDYEEADPDYLDL